jgi:hypothetical protein
MDMIVIYMFQQQVLTCKSIPTFVTMLSASVIVGGEAQHINIRMGEQEDDNTWVYGLSGICICILFVMGMAVFSALYFGVPGRVYLLWGWGSFLLCILEFQVGYFCYGVGGLFCCIFWGFRWCIFFMGMGVFSAVYFGVPGRVYLLLG